MSKYFAKIKVYSDIEDVSSIDSALKQLELKNLPIISIFSKRFSVEPNVVLIIQLNDIESNLLNKIIKIKNNIKNKILFVIPNNNALLVSSVAKLGFLDIFIFPYELYKFISYLEEIVVNNAFLTSTLSTRDFAENIDEFSSIIGQSKNLLKIIELAKKISERKDMNVLIRGETGTGKGLLARAIHNNSKESSGPFVDIVCSSIPENLLESELFGYEAGAFTNAKNKKPGLFELADDGTLFLDEIGDLSLNIQKKLLRTIEKKVIRHLGGIFDIPINNRLISATNMNLESLIENNVFRRDLYHRLNVVSLELPPLRDRDGDVILLAEHFINEFSKQFNKVIKKIDLETIEFISHYPWPGNIRELRNSMERAVLLTTDSVIRLKDFSNLVNTKPQKTFDNGEKIIDLPQFIKVDLNYTNTTIRKLNEIYAKQVLEKVKGNKSKTARILGISRPKLDSLLK
jgi:two-component system, NtrC family, response regulator AtoC